MYATSSISIHSPRMGRDPHHPRLWLRCHDHFNPLSPHGERLIPPAGFVISKIFQSTLPAWGETVPIPAHHGEKQISIHSPRMGRDPQDLRGIRGDRTISIHSPRMGRDSRAVSTRSPSRKFQSTLPAWGETFCVEHGIPTREFQSTLPAWGETPKATRKWVMRPFQSTLPAWGETTARPGASAPSGISIHSPRMGRDPIAVFRQAGLKQFQSTLPAWGETRLLRLSASFDHISIHSPRMGRDAHPPLYRRYFPKISIHSPRMGRDMAAAVSAPFIFPFQSTLPAWGETLFANGLLNRIIISIHSPRMGRDLRPRGHRAHHSHFNPLSPHGERPAPAGPRTPVSNFNPLSPHGERPLFLVYWIQLCYFNPLSPHGERLQAKIRPPQPQNFNPLSPHGERLHSPHPFPPFF